MMIYNKYGTIMIMIMKPYGTIAFYPHSSNSTENPEFHAIPRRSQRRSKDQSEHSEPQAPQAACGLETWRSRDYTNYMICDISLIIEVYHI